MTVRMKRVLTLLSSLLALMTLPGCWDYQRINYRDQVIMIGVQPVNDNPKLMRYTFQIPDFSKGAGIGDSGAGSGGQDSEKTRGPYRNYVEEAPSVGAAVAKAQLETDKTLFFGNLQVLVLDAHLAGVQIANTVNELMRNPQADKLAYVLFTYSDMDAVFNAKESVSPGDHISQWMEGAVMQHAYAFRTKLWEFWRDALSHGIDPAAAQVNVDQQDHLVLGGLVALKSTTPVVQLTPQETLGYNMAVGTITRVSIAFETNDNIFTVGGIHAHSKQSVRMANGQATLHEDIEVEGVLNQDGASYMGIVDQKQLSNYERTMERTMGQQVASVISKMQKKACDPFGFGLHYVLDHPAVYPHLNKVWPALYSKAKVQVDCHVVITRKGSLM